MTGPSRVAVRAILCCSAAAALTIVATATAIAAGAPLVDGRPVEGRVTGQARGEQRRLVMAGIPFQRRIVVGDFLQAEDVEISEGPRRGQDTAGIDAAIEAAAPLDVPGDQAHGGGGPAWSQRGRIARCMESTEGGG